MGGDATRAAARSSNDALEDSPYGGSQPPPPRTPVMGTASCAGDGGPEAGRSMNEELLRMAYAPTPTIITTITAPMTIHMAPM